MITASIPCIVRMYLFISKEKIIKSIWEEAIMINVHKTSHKKSVNVEYVKDIKTVKQECGMTKIFSSTNNILTISFCRRKSLFRLEG